MHPGSNYDYNKTERCGVGLNANAGLTKRSLMSTGAERLLEARCDYRLFADYGVINGTVTPTTFLSVCTYVCMYPASEVLLILCSTNRSEHYWGVGNGVVLLTELVCVV